MGNLAGLLHVSVYTSSAMKRPITPSSKSSRAKKTVLGKRAFEAITAIEGLSLSVDSKKRLQRLHGDKNLSPDDRRMAVLRAYSAMSRKTK